jgi:hypothetical protein
VNDESISVEELAKKLGKSLESVINELDFSPLQEDMNESIMISLMFESLIKTTINNLELLKRIRVIESSSSLEEVITLLSKELEL